jgi:hypothetical protein
MIPHTYLNASDDPEAWDADRVNRQAVTVEFAYAHLCDEPLWLHVGVEAVDMGLDPWRLIDSVDQLRDGGFDIWRAGAANPRRVPAGFRLFAQRSTLRKLGLPEGEPAGWAARHAKQEQKPA